MSNDLFNVSVIGHVNIKDITNNVVLLDKRNAIHPQNMARILARALAHEPNSYIYRLALGNGGQQYASDGSSIVKPPIDGSDGSGWESRLYNETYSEIVDETSSLVGTDPGSADANGIRPGGGAVPSDDPAPDSVVSQEVGTKSNVTVVMYLNENEPTAQPSSMTSTLNGAADLDFSFSELGLYSSGSQARDSSGYSTVNVSDSNSLGISSLIVNTQYNLTVTIDGTTYNSVISTPAAGTGASGSLTYGDICEGINTGTWVTNGDAINNFCYVYITDTSGGVYPSILGSQSYGYLIFQSKSSGAASSVNLSCTSGLATDFFNNIASGICGNVNFLVVNGAAAGVANDPLVSTNERERLLTHLTFNPIVKSQGSQIVITYILTVSVNPSVSTIVNELPSSS